jgi:uncharacterized protein
MPSIPAQTAARMHPAAGNGQPAQPTHTVRTAAPARISGMTTTEPLSSSAAVDTERASRYGKQLSSHLGRRIVTKWDERAETGVLQFDGGRCDVLSTPGQLLLRIELEPTTDRTVLGERLGVIEDVVGRHLVRFGARDELVLRWHRPDGSVGGQYAYTDDAPADHRPRR